MNSKADTPGIARVSAFSLYAGESWYCLGCQHRRFYEIFGPVRYCRSEKMCPAGKGFASEQTVVLNTVFFIHAYAGFECEAGFRILP